MAHYTSDPVHMDDHGQWWFLTVCQQFKHGPYANEQVARQNLSSYIQWLNSQQLPAAKQPSDLEKVTAEYMALRERKSALSNQFETDKAKLEDELRIAESFLINYMNEQGMQNFKTNGSLVYLENTNQASIGDKGAFMDYVRKTGRPELLQARVSSTELKAWLEAGNEMPPGVKIHSERVVRVRKSS